MDQNFQPITEQERANAPKVQEVVRVRTPVVPVPKSAIPHNFKHPVYGAPIESYPYEDGEGHLVGYTARFLDAEGGKHFYPLTWCRYGDRESWQAEGLPKPIPLYKLPVIMQRPDTTVLVVRGERNVEAAQRLFPQFVVTTMASGDSQIADADWTPVTGRTVVVLADADDREAAFIETVANHAYGGGAALVVAIPAALIAGTICDGEARLQRTIIPPDWTIGMAAADGWTPVTLSDHIGDISLLEPMPKPLVWDSFGNPRFRLTKNGVEVLTVTKDDMYWRQVCGPMEMVAATRTPERTGWAKTFRGTDMDGQVFEVDLPLAMLADDGAKIREILLDHGFYIKSDVKSRMDLLEFLSASTAPTRYIRVDTTGWYDNVFVTTNGVIGKHESGEEVRYMRKGKTSVIGKTAGSLASWRDEVAKLCQGNSRLVFAISAAFCGPLLKWTNSESTIYHFVGQSSKGKTTALVVAGSVWGGGDGKANIGTWRTTVNGAEGRAAGHSDAVMCNDEIGQVKSSELGQAAYTLCNEQSKQRSDRAGEARPVAVWRVVTLSSGEVDFETKLREDNPKANATAGQSVRFIDIVADAGQGLGLFETLHDFADARTMAEGLKRASLANYGHPGVAFVEAISRDVERTGATVQKWIDRDFAALNFPPDTDSQVLRVARRFMAVGAAGELAIRLNILPWPVGEASSAARKLFSEWLERRGSTQATERMNALSQVRYYILKHAERWFRNIDDDNAPKIAANAGFIKTVNGCICYCFPSDVWKRDVCAGLDPSFVAKVLVDEGHAETRDGRLNMTVDVGSGSMRVYVVKETLLADPVAPVMTQLTPRLFNSLKGKT
jgi:putative DNA primase/helicase